MDSGVVTPDKVLEFDKEVHKTVKYDNNGHSLHEPGNSKETYYENMKESEITEAIHIELLNILDDIYAEGRESKQISVERLIDQIINLINLCKTSNVILRKAVRLKKMGESLATHSVNVSILAVKILMESCFL